MLREKPPSSPDAEMIELFGQALNGSLDATQHARLEHILTTDAAARSLYRSYVNLHVTLRTYGVKPQTHSNVLDFPEPQQPVNSQADKPLNQSPSPAPSTRWRPNAWVTGLAAALVISLIVVALLGLKQAGSGRQFLVQVSRVADARLAEDHQIITINQRFKTGMLDIESGFTELAFQNGVRLVLEAPVRIELLGSTRVRLERGRAVACVPPGARGFAIETPCLHIIDLGTEFGVSVSDKGDTEVQVFRGSVVTQWKGLEGRKLDQQLTAGQAVHVGGQAAPQSMSFQPERFVRMFPAETENVQPAGPVYNRTRVEAIQVIPAPANVVIDGDISDWDRTGAFYSACLPPYHESYYVDGAMMYDDHYLYVSAHVGDPAPMLSRMDPTAETGHYSWRGGGVIVRLATDPALGWPLQGVGVAGANREHPNYGHRPQDRTDHIAHLSMWYHQPSGQPRLEVAYGMDFHGINANPSGWQGSFRRDPNGLGYTLEYRIPWSLLHASARPLRANDVVGANWTVHWSDEAGELSRGHLVEITNLRKPPFHFFRGDTWGKAIFMPRPLD